MTTEEGNRIIAERMGGVYYDSWKNEKYHHADPHFFFDKEELFADKVKFQLDYHQNWNSLMKAVIHIELLGYKVIIETNSCIIQSHDLLSVITTSEFFDNKKETVWQAVVQFIQWLNKTT